MVRILVVGSGSGKTVRGKRENTRCDTAAKDGPPRWAAVCLRVARSGSVAAKVVKSWVPRTWTEAWLRAARSSGQGHGHTYGARMGGQMGSSRPESRFEVPGSRDDARVGKIRYS